MDEPAAAAPQAVAATVALVPGDPISGSVTGADGKPVAFFGWLELMDALDALRGAGSDRRASRRSG